MLDYTKSKIYKIYNTVDDEIYVGSTCCSLSVRMAKHRAGAKDPRQKHYRIYKKMNELGAKNFFIVLIEEMPECQNKEQLHKREREKIEELKPSLNYAIPTRTYQEWVMDNYEHRQELDRQWFQKNKERKYETRKEWSKHNPDKIKEYKKRDYDKNKERYCAYKREPVECEICGKGMVRASLRRHLRTQHS